MKDLEQTYWWFVGRRFIVKKLLEKYFKQFKKEPFILDLGCGTGGNYEVFKNFGKVVGLDNSEKAIFFAREKDYSEIIKGDATDLDFLNKKFDCIAVLDVLEHIDNDEIVLQKCLDILRPQGILLLTVPAYQWLWSQHDEALGHKRRYLKSNLVNKVKSKGFDILSASYVITFLFPLIALYRLFNRIRANRQETTYVMVPPLINYFFIQFLRLEAVILKMGLRFPFGTSIVICARKPE